MRKEIHNARIIHVGDGEEGYPWWNEKSAEQLNNAFGDFNVEYMSIRGNHSNPSVFDGSVMMSHFKLLPDYTRMEIEGQSWLFVGGAVSINRLDRERGRNWWPDEEMKLIAELATPADVLITHAGPSFIHRPTSPMVEYYIRREEENGINGLRQMLIAEQCRHDRLFELVHPKNWYFGHYHHSESLVYQGCQIKQLDIAEFVLHAP